MSSLNRVGEAEGRPVDRRVLAGIPAVSGKGSRRLLGVVFCVFLFLSHAQGQQNVPMLMQQAITAQKAGETSLAIGLYRRVLQMRPKWGPAEYNLGLVMSVGRRYTEAAGLFSAALKHDPSLTDAYLFLGVAEYNLGDFHDALSSLKAFESKRPTDPHVHYYLAGCYSAIEDYSSAALEYLQQMRITPEHAELYYYLGHCYLAMAHEMQKNLLNASGGNYYVSLVFGEEDAQEGKTSLASQAFRRAIQRDPRRTEAYVALGELLLKSGQLVAAKAQFRTALAVNPGDCSALEGLGDAEFAAGNISDSLAIYIRAQKPSRACIPSPPLGHLGLASNDFRSRLQSLKARAALTHRGSDIALELARLEYQTPGQGLSSVADSEAWSDSRYSNKAAANRKCEAKAQARWPHSRAQDGIFVASCDQIHRDFTGATQALIAANPRDVVQLYFALRILISLSRAVLKNLAIMAPNSYLISVMRAEWLELRGENTEANSEYKIAVQSSGDDPDILIEYATFECKRNRLDDAVPILLKAVHEVPYNATANALLGYVYFTENQFDRAIPYLRKAIKANPGDEYSRIYLGESLTNLHKTREAVTILESAPSDHDGRIHYVLASCYRQLGQREEMQRAMAIFAERQKALHTSQNLLH